MRYMIDTEADLAALKARPRLRELIADTGDDWKARAASTDFGRALGVDRCPLPLVLDAGSVPIDSDESYLDVVVRDHLIAESAMTVQRSRVPGSQEDA